MSLAHVGRLLLDRPVKAVVSLALALVLAASALAQDTGVVKGRVLVKFRGGTTEASAQGVLRGHGARQVRTLSKIGVRVLEIPQGASEVEFAGQLRNRPEVEFAEPDCVLMPDGDPLMPNQWHISRVSAPTAWLTTQGSGDVVIAIIDTGCDPTHPDLAPKYVQGWNFYDNNADWSDVYGHGTAVAGCAAAATNNDLGVAGVGYDCKIMPLRISSPTGSGSTSRMADALVWAADRGARVANISYKVSTSSVVQSAAQYFMDRGGVVTVSAGNSGDFVASPDNPAVLTVTATDSNDVLTSWTTTGNNVDLSSPGSNVFTTNRGGGYGASSGTSFSAPIVAGAAALVVSANPALRGTEVRDIVRASADDFGASGWDPGYGWGRVNAARAVAMAVGAGGGGTADSQAPSVSFSSPSKDAVLSGSVPVMVGASDNVGVTSLELCVNGVPVTTGNSGSLSWSWDTTSYENGDYVLKATARDAAGNTSAATVTVSVANAPDTEAPTVAIVSPGPGETLRKPTSIVATANDNVGVVRVEFYVDGELIGTSTGPNFSVNWNVKKAGKGSHTILARAFDAAGNSAWSAVVTVKT